MKKLLIVFLAGMLVFPFSAEARWHKRHHNRGCCYGSDVAAGIIGTAAGVMLAEKMMTAKQPKKQLKPKVYIYEPEGKCYTIVSRKTGKIRQECVEKASDSIIYID